MVSTGNVNSQAGKDVEKIIIIAGSNGAGRTTFARDFLPREAQTLCFINADLIAAGLENFNKKYRHVVDSWALYDCICTPPKLIECSGFMNTKDIRLSSDPDMAGSCAAMQRAGRAAEDLAIRTNTEIITMIDGKVVRLTAEEIIKRRAAEGESGELKRE